MIFYFSGTGNSKWIAESLAELINDKAVDISEIKNTPNIKNENRIGFVFPIYAWGTPEPMLLFAKTISDTDVFKFGICTCGADAGKAMKYFSKTYPLDSSYSVIMPNNYIIASDIESDSVIDTKLRNAKAKIQMIADEIVNEKKTYDVKEGSIAGIKSSLINLGFNKFARSTKSFFAKDNCNKCGVCIEECPANAICFDDGKLKWKNRCYMCLKCINRCPKQAIEYGKGTKDRHRYCIEKYI